MAKHYRYAVSTPQTSASDTLSLQQRLWVLLPAIAAFITLSLLGAPSLADESKKPALDLKPFTASYIVSGKQGRTSSQRSLVKNDEGIWELEQQLRFLIFKIEEGSQFSIENGQIVPISYFHHRNIGSKNNQDVFFNWAAMEAKNSNKKDRWQESLNVGVLDRMSLPLQIRLDLLGGVLQNSKDYTVLDKGRSKTYRIEIVGLETMNTALGKRELLKIRQQRPGSSRETVSWLDPTLDYLMLHSQQDDDGEIITLEIESLQTEDYEPANRGE